MHFSNRIFNNIVYIAHSKNIIQENKDLTHQLGILKTQIVELEELKAENERLKKVLSFKEESPLNFLACPVLVKDSSNLSNSIIIGACKTHGVKQDAIIITAHGVVGRVIERSSGTSRVLLITDLNSRISAISSRSRCEGMLYGVSGGLCKMRYIPLESDIKKGDVVVTSGFSSYFSKGLILGSVVGVAKEPRGLSLYAIVKPKFDLSRLEEVLCIK